MHYSTKIADPHTLGAVIQQARVQKSMTQRQLAKELGTTQKWIWELEEGKNGLLLRRLFQAFSILDVELSADFKVNDE